MRKYKVVFSERAKKALKKMDKSTAYIIFSWLKKNIDGCENPRIHGKGLVENKSRQVEI